MSEKKRKNGKAEAVRTANGVVCSLLAVHLKGKVSEEERDGITRFVAEEMARQVRLLDGTASAEDKAWAKFHSPDPVANRAVSIAMGQGAS